MAITISDTTPRVQYTATAGQTSFAVNFEFFANTDLKVYNGTTLLTYEASPSGATKYSVTGAGVSGGGSITLGSPGATVNDKITIYRDMSIARSTDFPTSGAFQVESLNEELDKLTTMIQQVKRDLKYSPKAATTTANTYNLTFPELVADKILSVNSSGNALEFSQSITNVNTVAGIASNITTVSGIAANVTTVAGVHANVTTVANNIASVNTVATDIAKVITVANDLNETVSEIETAALDLQETTSEIDVVAGAITNVNNVGNDIANVNAVAGKATEIGLLGVSSVITDMGLLGTSAVVTDMDLLATSANVTAMGLLGTSAVVEETFQTEEKILPVESPEKQYEFAVSFLKVGDYNTAERAFSEFVQTNPKHKLAGNAQYWYAETFRIRQLYTDAASAYLEGYQKYPKGEKAPINLLKLGVSMVQIGEKDQGCKMINGVEKQYPKAKQSVIQKAKYESQKFECKNQNS